MTPVLPSTHVHLDGILGRALAANVNGRLKSFITDETSPPVALFAPQHAARNEEGDWYGEHAGKWLVAAAKAARRTGDVQLGATVRRVADYLVGVQGDDGYLGTYAASRRFTVKQPRGAGTWDGAPAQRTWDVWTHSYLILGLLEVHRHFPQGGYLHSARRIGDLCWKALAQQDIDITDLGNHFGLSATILLDPVMELYFATSQQRYLDLAQLIVEQMERREGLRLLSRAAAGADISEIATGKSYQLCWQLVGLVKLHRATGDTGLLRAVTNLWDSIQQHHLTLGGGPWGGVGQRSREVFNPSHVFSPYGYVETCATGAWLQLNRQLLALTGEAKYAQQIERCAYNDLLGAQAPNGEDWCYYSFPNGRRVFTTYWRCCKSSGAMALEELPEVAYTVGALGTVAVNLYCAGTAVLQTPAAGRLRIEQDTRYPFEGDVLLRLNPERTARFELRLLVPDWADGAWIEVNGVRIQTPLAAGTFASVEREWRPGDEVRLHLPLSATLHRRSSRNVQQSRAPDGSAVEQEVMRYDYVAVTRGPLVYASGLIDGYKMEETLPAEPRLDAEVLQPAPGCEGPGIRLSVPGRSSLELSAYYEAGGRADGTWRLTWLQLPPMGGM